MTLEEQKQKMKSFVDLFGRQLLEHSEIDKSCSVEELQSIIRNHETHIEMACNDAQNSLTRFAVSINLF